MHTKRRLAARVCFLITSLTLSGVLIFMLAEDDLSIRPPVALFLRDILNTRNAERLLKKRPKPLIQKASTKRMPRSTAIPSEQFPAFGHAEFPVSVIPNWGVMHTATEWDERYENMHSAALVPVPPYDLERLTIPMNDLSRNREVNAPIITEKLFYSTRFFGRYSPDSSEFEGNHAGVDLKLAAGTSIRTIAGGRVHATGIDDSLGNFVMVEHELPKTGVHVVSIYGHLESILVREGQGVTAGDSIGRVGSTGRSSSPHLHLQIDYKQSPGRHRPYVPNPSDSREKRLSRTIHPLDFISKYSGDTLYQASAKKQNCRSSSDFPSVCSPLRDTD